jgi:outer membrane protein OmpA-like peptidoglycan-associated protein
MKINALSIIVLSLVSSGTMAAAENPYWTDVNGDIVRSGFGECVRTIHWTPEAALEECGDGAVKAAKPEPAPAAAVAAVPVVAPVDSDGDGVTDDKDKCPDSPSDRPVDENGCTIESVVLKGVNFELNSSELTAGSSESLDKAVDAMNKYGDLRIEIRAHTDSMGEAAYNQSLSEKRANSVRDYMISKGIAANRMVAKGYGETKPIADNGTREGRAENRRVELKVIE